MEEKSKVENQILVDKHPVKSSKDINSILSESLQQKTSVKELFNSYIFRILITFFLFFLLFAITFFVSYTTIEKRRVEATKNIVPEAEIKLPSK